MSPRSIRRAAERRAKKLALKAEKTAAAAGVSSPSDRTPNVTEPRLRRSGLSDFSPASVNAGHAVSSRTPSVNEGHAVSRAQLAANRQNAQHSTGPTSSAGKAKVSLNAVKTGLTGRTVLLPSDDARAYAEHVDNYNDEFQPCGLRECELVQSLADLSWRLQRIPALEMAIYTHGRIEFAGEFDDHDAALRPSMIELQTFLTYEKQLRNLQLQEGRLSRRYDKELAELRQLQQDRKAKEREALAAAARAALLARQRHENFDPQANGFDFSTEEIDRHIRTPSPQTVDRMLTVPDRHPSLGQPQTRKEAA